MTTRPQLILIGCTGWSYPEWNGPFYPAGMKPSDYLHWYSRQFPAVEIDSTFYQIPTPRTVDGWCNHTPADFRFTAKVPRTITHLKRLRDCAGEVERFVRAIEPLGDKLLGALLQMGYLSQTRCAGLEDFLETLDTFLVNWPHAGVPLAVEIRNPKWVCAELVEVLRRHHAALTLTIWKWMPRPAEIVRRVDPVTGPFAYVRLMRDREPIHKTTQSASRTVIDRSEELAETAEVVRELSDTVPVVVFADNQYAGFAPATARQFRQILDALETASLSGPGRASVIDPADKIMT